MLPEPGAAPGLVNAGSPHDRRDVVLRGWAPGARGDPRAEPESQVVQVDELLAAGRLAEPGRGRTLEPVAGHRGPGENGSRGADRVRAATAGPFETKDRPSDGQGRRFEESQTGSPLVRRRRFGRTHTGDEKERRG